MPVLRLTRNEAVKLYGPMSVSVNYGLIDVHGRLVRSGERFVVHKTRNYIVIAQEESELDISMIDESQIQTLEQDDPYITKRTLVEEIAGNPNFKSVMIIGCTDCGKTLLTTVLYNISLRSGRRPAVIDSDVGQADIGPPGFVTLGSSSEPVFWINELRPLVMRFIGDIKPQIYSSLIVEEVRELFGRAISEGFNMVIIDTDGWVREESGIMHKLQLIETIRPDVVIALGEELKGVFAKASKLGFKLYEIPAPRLRKTRTREERRLLRSLKYKEYLENAKPVRLKLENIYVSRLPLLQGVEIDPSTIRGVVEGNIVYVSKLSNTIYIYGEVKDLKDRAVDEQRRQILDRVKVYPAGFEKSIYCSVGSFTTTDYPCIVERFDLLNREIIIKTKYTGVIDVLKFSKIRLTDDFTEEYVEV